MTREDLAAGLALRKQELDLATVAVQAAKDARAKAQAAYQRAREASTKAGKI